MFAVCSAIRVLRQARFLTILGIAAVLTLSVLALNKQASYWPAAVVPNSSFEASPSAVTIQSPGAEPRGAAQIVHFTLYDAGIFPRQVYARPGLVAIYIQDLSDGSQGLVVEREGGPQVAQVTRDRDKKRGRSRIALGAGRYRVYDASQPRNRAILIVRPN